MKYIVQVICVFSLMLCFANITLAQGTSCQTATPMCADIPPYPINFTGTGAGTGPQAPAGPNYDCLLTTPSPTFFTLTITQSGTIQFDIQNSSVVDIDFILWGPFTDLFAAYAACGNMGNGGASGNVIDCSYDPQAFETVDITNAVAGEVYIMMITNYANVATNVFTTPNIGTGAVGCPCQLDVTYSLPPLANNMGLMTAVSGDSAEYTVCPGDTLYMNMAISADNIADTLTIFNTLTTIANTFSPSQYEIFGPFYPNAPLMDSMEILIMITPGPNDVGIYNFTMGVENSGTSNCFDSYPITVVIPGIPDLPEGDTICSGGSYQMMAGSFPATASGSDTYLWTQISGPVAVFDDNTLQNPTITPPVIPSGDSMSFQLQYTYGNCSQFDTVTIYGYDISINMTASPNPVCAGQPVQLTAILTDSVGAETTTTCLPTYVQTLTTYGPTPGSGTSVALGDDALSAALPIGFSFDFFCNTYTQFYICSNGFISFDPTAAPIFSPQFIPNAATPNDLIAINWTDLDPTSGGTIEYFTTGAAPNRRLIVNFINVPTYEGWDNVTVQLILYEGTNIIEEHTTNAIDNQDLFGFSVDPITIGIENATGTAAYSPGVNQISGNFVNQAVLYTPNITTTSTSAPISYLWEPAATLNNNTVYDPIASPTTPTNYMVTITNGACAFTDSIQVNITGSLPAPVVSCGISTYTTIPFSWTDIGLPGGGFYEYSTDGGATWTNVGTALNATLVGLSPDSTVSILVRGNDGLGTPCSPGAQGMAVCSTLPCMMTLMDSVTHVVCFGDATGEIDLTQSNGSPNFVYAWDNGATTEDLTGLVAGVYVVTLTDAVGCTLTDSITITEPAKGLGLTFDLFNPLCNGSSDGCAVVNVAYGTGAYSYNWSAIGLSTDSICGLMAGTYTITVTDTVTGGGAGGNLILYEEAFDGVHGWNPNVPTGVNGADNNFWVFNSNEAGVAPGGCGTSGGTNRSMHITSVFNSSGGAAYDAGGLCGLLFCPETNMRTESPSFSTVGQSNINLSFNYIANGEGLNDNCSVVYSDNGGASWQVVTPSIKSGLCGAQGLWTAFTVALPASCDNNPAVKVGFNWTNNDDGLGTDPSVAIDSVVVWTPQATGLKVCVALDTFTLTEPTAIVITVDSTTNVACNGGNTGIAYVSSVGGSGVHSYSWSNGSTTAMASGLIANVYTVSVTDTNMCVMTENITITEPSVLTAVVDSTISPTCNGTADGGIYISAVDGMPVYSYNWSNGATTGDLTAIASGNYSVTVTDANGCTTTIDTSINQPGAVSVAIDSANNISCNGAADGMISVSGSSGTPAYSFIWSNGATDASISGLAANTYTVTISDQNACTDTISMVITEPSLLMATDSVVNILCNGDATGQAFVMPSGGMPSYSYNWSNTATTQSISGVLAGIYTVTVTDAGGCTISNSVTITEPATGVALSLVSSSNLMCHGDSDGDATVNASGGTGTFTYQWDAAAGSQATAMATGLAAGAYTATATDGAGCTDILSVTITEPSAMTVSATVTDESCLGTNNGSIAISASGGTLPYTYVWDGAAAGQTSATATGLVAATYNVTITDDNGCIMTSGGTVNPSVPLDSATVPLTVVTGVLDCDLNPIGNLTINPTSGTGYTYLWSNGATDQSATGLTNGSYTVTITNSSGCTMTQSGMVVAPFVPNVNPWIDNIGVTNTSVANGTAVAIDGGNDQSAQGVTYVWTSNSTDLIFGSNTDHSTTAESTIAGVYMLTITATSGSIPACTDTGSVTLTVESSFMGLPNAFTPNNGDNVNDIFAPVGLNANEVIEFKIFNRWGQEIYNGPDLEGGGWDGTYKGVEQPSEVYLYLLQYQLGNSSDPVLLKGEVTLIR